MPSMRASTASPLASCRAASGATVTRTRSCDASCTDTSGAPGAAKAPGSTKRRVTMPAKGACTEA
jgi:hypothetical protein